MAAPRKLKLKRPDRCQACETALEVGTLALWDAAAKTVTCLACLGEETLAAPAEAEPKPLERGTPGASAQRRFDSLHDKRERQARASWGRFSGLYLALTSDPQSTTAWAEGSEGERRLGAFLERLNDEASTIVLHDRRIPGTKTNIDHIAITRSGGVWAIDAKNYAGMVQSIDRGGWLSTDLRLYVGERDCTKLLAGANKQAEAIQAALGQPVIEEFAVQVRSALCFVKAEWELFAKPFQLEGVWVGWAGALAERLGKPGDLEPEHLLTLAKRVADALPPA